MTDIGAIAHKKLALFIALLAALSLALVASPALAQVEAEAEATAVADDGVPADASGEAAGYTPLGPEMIKGQPVDGGLDVQPQYSELGESAASLHVGLVWIMALISAFVLALLLWVMLRYNKRANPVPSKTSHNTLIEVIWTLVPVLILVGIAIPSMRLLAAQYESPPEDALTVKVTGYQWYWGYTYPDNGGFEVISNMLDESEAVGRGLPAQLAVDNRMVVPVGESIRLQTTAADVIHAFAVPALWFKLDAVPGRLNEKILKIKEPGIYYGQCSELCGVRHGYMPIAIEAVPREQFEAWIRSKGGQTRAEAAAEAEAAETAAAAEAAAAEAASVEEAPAEEAAPAA